MKTSRSAIVTVKYRPDPTLAVTAAISATFLEGVFTSPLVKRTSVYTHRYDSLFRMRDTNYDETIR